MDGTHDERRSERSLARRLALALFLLVLVGCLFVAGGAVGFFVGIEFEDPKSRVLWEAAPGDQDPTRFQFLAFPADLDRFQESDLPPRAVLLGIDEWNSDRSVITAYSIDGDTRKIAKAALTLRPDKSLVSPHVQSLNEAIQSWGASTDWKGVAFETLHGEAPVYRLILDGKDGTLMVYEYTINNREVVPLRIAVRRGGL